MPDAAELRSLLGEATPRPWTVVDQNEDYPQEYGHFWVIAGPEAEDDEYHLAMAAGVAADVNLAAGAVNNLEPLLDEIERLREIAWLLRRKAARDSRPGTHFPDCRVQDLKGYCLDCASQDGNIGHRLRELHYEDLGGADGE